jgi:hypothetical protein
VARQSPAWALHSRTSTHLFRVQWDLCTRLPTHSVPTPISGPCLEPAQKACLVYCRPRLFTAGGASLCFSTPLIPKEDLAGTLKKTDSEHDQITSLPFLSKANSFEKQTFRPCPLQRTNQILCPFLPEPYSNPQASWPYALVGSIHSLEARTHGCSTYPLQ